MLFLWSLPVSVPWKVESSVIDLSSQTWAQVVDGHSSVLVDYYTPWCPQCQSLVPMLEKAAQLLPDVRIARVNAEEEPGLLHGTSGSVLVRPRGYRLPMVHLDVASSFTEFTPMERAPPRLAYTFCS